MRDRLGVSTGARGIGLVAMLALDVVGVGVRVVGAAGAQQGDPTTFGSNVRSGGDISTPDFRVTRYKGVSATQDVSSSSTAYTNMPGLSISFRQGGTIDSPVMITFQGEWIGSCTTQDRALLRLTIDGVTQPGPGDDNSPFSAHEGTEDSTNGFTFVSAPVSPGIHTASIQWASVGGNSICVDERQMILEHR